MKVLKISLVGLLALVLSYGAFKVSTDTIASIDSEYVVKSPAVAEAPPLPEVTADVDKIMSHPVPGTKEAVLPVDTEQDYVIYETELFVTVNEGESWIPVPDDHELGYARVNEYLDDISRSNTYISPGNIAIVYGGRGPENISILRTDSRGQGWSVGSISRTATQDLGTGYEEMHIDFIDSGQTGYLAAVRDGESGEAETLIFRSVNAGVTWDPISSGDALYEEIMAHFDLRGMRNE
ncbi:hypothetical protein M1Q06_03660 [Planococcus sp. 11815]|uniref:hypothetical protein n=1 Tax=Planococcus sp. 11815 TaxID=2939413 RepID=UPI003DA520DE